MLKKISNISRTLIINTFEGFYYNEKTEINNILKHIFKIYDVNKLLKMATLSADVVNTEIINKSISNFEPFGDSASMLIKANLKNCNSAVLHLKESHITFHTYIEDGLENFLIVRFEIHISSCTDENIFLTIPMIINQNNNQHRDKLNPHMINIDYLERGIPLSDIKKIDVMFADNFINNNFKRYNCISHIISSNTQYYSLMMNEPAMHNTFDKMNIPKLKSKLSSFIKNLSNIHSSKCYSAIDRKISEK